MSTGINNGCRLSFSNGDIVVKGFKINDEAYDIVVSNSDMKFLAKDWSDAGQQTLLIQKITQFVNNSLKQSNDYLPPKLDSVRFVYAPLPSGGASTNMFFNSSNSGFELGAEVEEVDKEMCVLQGILQGTTIVPIKLTPGTTVVSGTPSSSTPVSPAPSLAASAPATGNHSVPVAQDPKYAGAARSLTNFLAYLKSGEQKKALEEAAAKALDSQERAAELVGSVSQPVPQIVD